MENIIKRFSNLNKRFNAYKEKTRRKIELWSREGKPIRRDWHPSLKRMLRHITSPKCNLIQNPNMKRALDKFTNQKDEFLSHDDLNFFVHNQYYTPNEEVLRSFWGQLEGLFQIILVEPDSK